MPVSIKVGVFSPNDPRPWVCAENLPMMLKHERALLCVLARNGCQVVRGGDGFPGGEIGVAA